MTKFLKILWDLGEFFSQQFVYKISSTSIIIFKDESREMYVVSSLFRRKSVPLHQLHFQNRNTLFCISFCCQCVKMCSERIRNAKHSVQYNYMSYNYNNYILRQYMIWKYFKPKLPGEIECRGTQEFRFVYLRKSLGQLINALMRTCVSKVNDKHVIRFTSLWLWYES